MQRKLNGSVRYLTLVCYPEGQLRDDKCSGWHGIEAAFDAGVVPDRRVFQVILSVLVRSCPGKLEYRLHRTQKQYHPTLGGGMDPLLRGGAGESQKRLLNFYHYRRFLTKCTKLRQGV